MRIQGCIKLAGIYCLLWITTSSCRSDISSEKHQAWEVFTKKIETGDVAYLLAHSLDTIDCVDCNQRADQQRLPAWLVYKNYRDRLYNKNELNNRSYTVYEDDSIVRISYEFQENIFRLEGWNRIYMFRKKNDTYWFEGMITIP
ncbi:hypothetical protein ACFSTE_19800 [Aquimarina hainanensis]|uniref:DUF4348 domain-containing protein n=1 Tax=Aquimarina hainanensis TaxID=1578017 RepID=A0ABW5NC29_9FLAO